MSAAETIDSNEYKDWLDISKNFVNIQAMKEAYSAASQAVFLAKSKEESWIHRGNLQIKLGNYEQAEDDYTQALILSKLHQNKKACWESMGKRAYVRSIIGDYQGAVDDLLILRKETVLNKQNIQILSYCKAMLLKD